MTEEDEREVYLVEEWLSDDTVIGEVTWETLRDEAMQPFYNETEEFRNLTEVE